MVLKTSTVAKLRKKYNPSPDSYPKIHLTVASYLKVKYIPAGY